MSAYQTIRKTKSYPQTKSALLSEAILCRGIGCKVKFIPKRNDQVFCSPACKEKFFVVARKLGTKLLDKSRTDLKLNSLIWSFLKEIQD
jgi:hypothetical protein